MRSAPTLKYIVIFSLALIFTGFLGFLAWQNPPSPAILPQAALFLVLVVSTTLLGVPLGGGKASLLPMAVVATYLALGLVPAGWIALLGEVISEVLEPFIQDGEGFGRPKGPLEKAARLATNASLQPASILIAGAAYQVTGGMQPLVRITPYFIVPFILLGLTYLLVNYLGAGLFFAGRGRSWLETYLRAMPPMLAYEGLPLLFAPWVALVPVRMGPGMLAALVVALTLVAWTARSLAFARQRLERRVRELAVLQDVGRALSANLNLDDLLQAIYTQVVGLMPADNFYIALSDPDLDEVSFLFVIEAGQRTTFPTPSAGAGLTEYILHTGQPLLSRTTTAAIRQQLGESPHTGPAASWLGVPLLVGDRPIGVMTLQSYAAGNLYDEGHQVVLTALAAQAAIAIQNARLFSRTDQDLNLRLRQLDSILKAVQDGMLFLDCQGQVVLVNRAAADYLGLAQLRPGAVGLDPQAEMQIQQLADRLGYAAGELEQVLVGLMAGEAEFLRQTLNLPHAPELAIERTLMPVRSRDGEVSGWLLVLHDRTQQVRLATLQEDMIEMLVHDLRSPLTIIQGGLDVIEERSRGTPDASGTLDGQPLTVLAPMKHSTQRMLRMVNDMLEINRLEKGELVVEPTCLPVRPFLTECASQYSSLLMETGIELVLLAPVDLPDLWVDAEHAGRILQNLLDNAIKFTPDHGTITLTAHLERKSAAPFILISIQDTGLGIPLAAQRSLFEKYRQLEGSSGRQRGNGLGLYYCRLVVEAHGGKIWVESPPQQGACFHILLPAIDG